MFTNEAQNVAEAFPAFLKMLRSVQNPFGKTLQPTPPPAPMETVAKAIWFVVPFHFLSFLGQGGSTSADISSLVLVGIGALVVLMWAGTLLGIIRIGSSLSYDDRARLWVAGLVCTWFFCVLTISVLAFALWVCGGFEGWPDMPSWWKQRFGLLKGEFGVSAMGAAVGTLCTYIAMRLTGHPASGSHSKICLAFFLGPCFLICVAIMWASSELLSI